MTCAINFYGGPEDGGYRFFEADIPPPDFNIPRKTGVVDDFDQFKLEHAEEFWPPDSAEVYTRFAITGPDHVFGLLTGHYRYNRTVDLSRRRERQGG